MTKQEMIDEECARRLEEAVRRKRFGENMKLKIEKTAKARPVKLTYAKDNGTPPEAIEMDADKIDMLIKILMTAKNASKFSFVLELS